MNNLTYSFETVNLNSLSIGFIIGINFSILSYIFINKYFNFTVGCFLFINKYLNIVIQCIFKTLTILFYLLSFIVNLLYFLIDIILKESKGYLKSKDKISRIIDCLIDIAIEICFHAFAISSRLFIFKFIILKNALIVFINLVIKIDKILDNFLFSSFVESHKLYAKIFSIKIESV